MVRGSVFWGWLVLGMLFGSSLQAEERYYMIVFGYENGTNRPVMSHTFAAFLRQSEIDSGLSVYQFPTISWLPASGRVNPLFRQAGVNLGVVDTVALGRSEGSATRAWGPFEITGWLYQRAMQRIASLNSGYIDYKMIDGMTRPKAFGITGGAMNCIHAVSDLLGFLETDNLHGYSASVAVLQFLSRQIINYPQQRADIAERINMFALISGYYPPTH